MKAGIYLKILIRVLILLIIALLVFYYTENRVTENEPLESPVKQGTAVPVLDKELGSAIPQTSRPEEGLSTYVGKSAEELIEKIGKPARIEPSAYGYDWWIYKGDYNVMVGITKDNMINQVYASQLDSNVSPFEIGQNINDIYRFTIVGSEIDVEIEDNLYTFSLNSEDLQTRLLIVYKGLFAQLYVDQQTGELLAIRFIDPATLVLHQPYEMTYMGDLLVPKPPSSKLQDEVDRAVEKQIFELTNMTRIKYDVDELINEYVLKDFARDNSKQLSLDKIMKDDVVTVNLSKRLKEATIEHQKAGENIATDYVDAIDAVHGWINSPNHRSVLLNKDFTHMGIGAYGNYYTQLLIQKSKEEVNKNNLGF